MAASALAQPLPRLIEQLAQFPLQGCQIQAQIGPAAGIDLPQQPQSVLGQLIQQEAGAWLPGLIGGNGVAGATRRGRLGGDIGVRERR